MATLPVNYAVSRTQRVVEAVIVALVAAALAVSFAPCFANLVSLWNANPNNNYGYLVIPIALWILWDRRGEFDRARLSACWWGFIPLVGLMVLRAYLYERNEQFIEAFLIPWVAAFLVLTLGGWHLLRVSLPALIFLFFMLPLPPSINGILAGPLQSLATHGSLLLMQVTGLPVYREGNVIFVGEDPLEVARACNGLSMLVTFVALNAAAVLVSRRPLWERVIVMISAIPIALVSNIVRIVITGWCYYRYGSKFGNEIAHDWFGYAMMLFGLILLQLELWLLSWLFVEVEEMAFVAPRRRAAVENGVEKV